MTAYKRILAFFFVVLVFACTPAQNIAKEVERDTREKRKYAIIMTAEGMGYTMNLRENSFFDFHGRGEGETSSSLYAGSYERKGDSLLLAFQNNYKPLDLVGTGKFNWTQNTLTLFSKDPARHRVLTVVKK